MRISWLWGYLILSLLLGWLYLGIGHYQYGLWPTDLLQQQIWSEIRLPRLLLAWLNGCALGAAGATLQIILRNPLAEPGLTGVAGGAAVATVLVLYFGWLGAVSLWLPLIGLLGGATSLLVLWAIAGRNPSGTHLILAGVAVAAAAGAVLAVILNLAPNPFAFQELSLWLMGSVANRGWPQVWLIAPCVVLGGAILYYQRAFISAHMFDQATLLSLGFRYARSMWLVLLAVTLLVAGSVVSAGIIGFVGLIAPHLVRMLGVQQPSLLVWYSTLSGGLLLVIVDALVKWLPTRVELHLGVVAAIIGAPLLILLLQRHTKT
jgi:iron complex transport system permease protein